MSENDLIQDILTLYGNAQYYQSIGELEGAAISYTSVSSIIHTIIKLNKSTEIPDSLQPQLVKLKIPDENTIRYILNQSLAQLDGLQERIRKSRTKADNDDDEEEQKYLECNDIQNLQFKDKSSNCLFFDDLIGLKNEKQVIESKFIQPLKYPNLFPALGKGILLYGFPGTGKTLLAKASVNELQSNDPNIRVLFFSATGAELKGKYVGETEKKIKKYFNCAHQHACECEKRNREAGKPNIKVISIIFIDEIDSIAGSREDDPTGLRANSVNTLLQMMDGINSKKNVSVIAATNFPWLLDTAVLRRFDQQLFLDVPAQKAIKETIILELEKNYKFRDYDSGCTEKKSGKKEEKPPYCDSSCKKSVKESKYMGAFRIDLLEKENEVDLITSDLDKENYSSSDINKLMIGATTLSGEDAVSNGLFYKLSPLINDYPNLKRKLQLPDKPSVVDKPLTPEEIQILVNQFKQKYLQEEEELDDSITSYLTNKQIDDSIQQYQDKLDLIKADYIRKKNATCNDNYMSTLTALTNPDLMKQYLENYYGDDGLLQKLLDNPNDLKLQDLQDSHFHFLKIPEKIYIEADEQKYINIKCLPFICQTLPRKVNNIDNIYLSFDRQQFLTYLNDSSQYYPVNHNRAGPVTLLIEKENIKLKSSQQLKHRLYKYKFLYDNFNNLFTSMRDFRSVEYFNTDNKSEMMTEKEFISRIQQHLSEGKPFNKNNNSSIQKLIHTGTMDITKFQLSKEQRVQSEMRKALSELDIGLKARIRNNDSSAATGENDKLPYKFQYLDELSNLLMFTAEEFLKRYEDDKSLMGYEEVEENNGKVKELVDISIDSDTQVLNELLDKRKTILETIPINDFRRNCLSRVNQNLNELRKFLNENKQKKEFKDGKLLELDEISLQNELIFCLNLGLFITNPNLIPDGQNIDYLINTYLLSNKKNNTIFETYTYERYPSSETTFPNNKLDKFIKNEDFNFSQNIPTIDDYKSMRKFFNYFLIAQNNEQGSEQESEFYKISIIQNANIENYIEANIDNKLIDFFCKVEIDLQDKNVQDSLSFFEREKKGLRAAGAFSESLKKDYAEKKEGYTFTDEEKKKIDEEFKSDNGLFYYLVSSSTGYAMKPSNEYIKTTIIKGQNYWISTMLGTVPKLLVQLEVAISLGNDLYSFLSQPLSYLTGTGPGLVSTSPNLVTFPMRQGIQLDPLNMSPQAYFSAAQQCPVEDTIMATILGGISSGTSSMCATLSKPFSYVYTFIDQHLMVPLPPMNPGPFNPIDVSNRTQFTTGGGSNVINFEKKGNIENTIDLSNQYKGYNNIVLVGGTSSSPSDVEVSPKIEQFNKMKITVIDNTIYELIGEKQDGQSMNDFLANLDHLPSWKNLILPEDNNIYKVNKKIINAGYSSLINQFVDDSVQEQKIFNENTPYFFIENKLFGVLNTDKKITFLDNEKTNYGNPTYMVPGGDTLAWLAKKLAPSSSTTKNLFILLAFIIIAFLFYYVASIAYAAIASIISGSYVYAGAVSVGSTIGSLAANLLPADSLVIRLPGMAITGVTKLVSDGYTLVTTFLSGPKVTTFSGLFTNLGIGGLITKYAIALFVQNLITISIKIMLFCVYGNNISTVSCNIINMFENNELEIQNTFDNEYESVIRTLNNESNNITAYLYSAFMNLSRSVAGSSLGIRMKHEQIILKDNPMLGIVKMNKNELKLICNEDVKNLNITLEHIRKFKKGFSSTYNKDQGVDLQNYNKDRQKFLQDLSKKKKAAL